MNVEFEYKTNVRADWVNCLEMIDPEIFAYFMNQKITYDINHDESLFDIIRNNVKFKPKNHQNKFQEQISNVKKFNVKLNGKENAIELNKILIKKMTCDINANKNAFDKIKDKINQPQNFIKKN